MRLQKGGRGRGEPRHQAVPADALTREAKRKRSEHTQEHGKAATGKEETGERGDRVRARQRKKRTALVKRANTRTKDTCKTDCARRQWRREETVTKHRHVSMGSKQVRPACSGTCVSGEKSSRATRGGAQAQHNRRARGTGRMGRKRSRKHWWRH